MLSAEALYDIERRFRAAQTDAKLKKEPFGGRHVIFAGDLYQLPPVMAKPLYAPLDPRDKNYAIKKEAGSTRLASV